VEDADKLHAEGAVYKLYNAEFKMDVFFPVPDRPTTASADLVDFYLRTEVRGPGVLLLCGCIAALAGSMMQFDGDGAGFRLSRSKQQTALPVKPSFQRLLGCLPLRQLAGLSHCVTSCLTPHLPLQL
jgi:hypothetical protein